jgi:HEAT repeat protein
MTRRALLALVVLAVLGIGLWLLLGARGPVYRGKSLTQWVDDCSQEVRTNRFTPGYYYFLVTTEYPRAVRHLGPSAVPKLTGMVESKHRVEERLYRFFLARKWQNQVVSNYLNKLSLDLLRPQTAAYFLGCLGPDAEPAIPALMRAAVDTNDILSRNALDALGAIHQRPEVVIPFLIGLANGTNSLTSMQALSALAQFTQQPEMVLPTLIRALEQVPTNPWADTPFLIVASRLGPFGTNAVAAIPALRNVATNSARELQTRFWAANALRQIAPDSSDDAVVPVYITVLVTKGSVGGYDAVLRLYELGPRARAATPALLHFIASGDPQRTEACYALKAVDPDAAAKIWPDELRRSRESAIADYYLRNKSETLDQFASRYPARDDKTVSELIAILKKDDKSFTTAIDRKYAAHLLGEMGPAARAAIPALLDETIDSPTAFAAVMKIRGQSVAPLIVQLQDAVRQRDMRELFQLAPTLGEFGTNAEAAVPFLVNALNLPPEYLPSASIAAVALGEIHRQPEVCVPALIPLLDFPSASVRIQAVEALGKFQNAAAPALPHLVQSLDDLDASVRLAATNALNEIDPAAAEPRNGSPKPGPAR